MSSGHAKTHAPAKSRGPAKSFDPDAVLKLARDVFWRRGYDGTSISELESVLGIGRKSLYDTFGSKRELYLRALGHYADTVVQRICLGLEDPRNSAMENLERVLGRLQTHHSSRNGLGCLLGVAMAQADPADAELAALLRGYLRQLATAFERTIERAQAEGTIEGNARSKDVARNLVALTQGMALMGRVAATPALPSAVVRAGLHALKSKPKPN